MRLLYYRYAQAVNQELGEPVPRTSLTVITWNINFRLASALDPLAVLSSLPDIVTLQEVTHDHADGVRKRLHDMGYQTMYSGHPDSPQKRYGNVVAARMHLTPAHITPVDFPWPQLVAHAIVETPNGPVHVVTVHVPNGSRNGWKKIDTFDGLKDLVLSLKGAPLILTGDFNEPRWAPPQDGHIVTWGQDEQDGRWLPWSTWTFDGVSGTGKRWDTAVRWFFETSTESGIRHAFWDKAGHGAMEPSHISRGAERWFDHLFVSSDFEVESCVYKHSFRTDGFSDHSAVLATLFHTH